jgi:hypothetical protein
MLYQRFPKNAEGDFYTTGECLSCGIPEHLAPECLAPLDAPENELGETYFLRQPATPGEVRNVCAAAKACCVDAIRYGGTDAEILRLLDNDRAYCDYPHGRRPSLD